MMVSDGWFHENGVCTVAPEFNGTDPLLDVLTYRDPPGGSAPGTVIPYRRYLI